MTILSGLMALSRKQLGPWLFGVALASFAALMVHWVVLIWQHEESGVSNREQTLTVATHRVAKGVSLRRHRPPLGPAAGEPNVEIFRPGSPLPQGAVSLAPQWPGLAVRPAPAALERLRDKRRRRSMMVTGEGIMAALLFCVMALMLWRLLQAERHRREGIEAFISTVSHELKTPLAGIKAFLDTQNRGQVPPERLGDFLELGLREVDRLEHLVENLLIANRISREALQVHLSAVPLGEFLADYLRHRSALLPTGHGGMSLAGDDPATLTVRADRDKLRVVLENLTDNALKYGGEKEVQLVVESDARQVVLAVCDQGMGFEPSRAEELFGGRRLAAESQVGHGTGLGLGIARSLARAMGGEVLAHSDGPGRGSRFSVELPREEVS